MPNLFSLITLVLSVWMVNSLTTAGLLINYHDSTVQPTTYGGDTHHLLINFIFNLSTIIYTLFCIVPYKKKENKLTMTKNVIDHRKITTRPLVLLPIRNEILLNNISVFNDSDNKNNVMNENNNNYNTIEIHQMKNSKAMNDFVYTSTGVQPNISIDVGIPSTKHMSVDTEKSKVSNLEISLACCCCYPYV